MTIDQAISAISQLPVAEQILVVQAIWDNLAEDAIATITPEVEEELKRRWVAYQADPSSAISLDEFRKQVREAREQ
jgi:putative addiction module component (TIGR02574 family)